MRLVKSGVWWINGCIAGKCWSMRGGGEYMVAFAHLYCAKCGTGNPAQAAFCFACGHPLQAPAVGPTISSSTGLLVQNHLLKQRYHILGQVGKGGFGAVYKAADTLFGYRLVAVKEMSQSHLTPHEVAKHTDAFKPQTHMTTPPPAAPITPYS